MATLEIQQHVLLDCSLPKSSSACFTIISKWCMCDSEPHSMPDCGPSTQLIHTTINTKGWTLSHNLNMTIGLWKGARLTLGEYLWQMEPQMGSVGTNWVFGTQAHLGQKLLKDKLEIAVAVYNPHSRETTFKTKSETPTYRQWSNNGNISRCIRLSVSYNFGKQGLYVKRTNAKADDGGDNIGGSSKGAGM